jgi:hypothetical protein
VKKTYQGMEEKSKRKIQVLGRRELLVEMALPMAEVWKELQEQVEELTGQAGLKIIGAILENEVRQRVGPPHHPGPASLAVRWGRQPGYVIFSGRKVAVERPRVRTLTVHRLGVGALLRRTLASTNPIESCFSVVEKVARNVKRWREGAQTLRWAATGLLEAQKKFRRVKGYRELESLNRKLNPSLTQQAQVA